MPSDSKPERKSDRDIVAELSARIGGAPIFVEYDEQGNATLLSLERRDLTQLPEQVIQLQHLQRLYLGGNQLSRLPRQIARLRRLKELDLRDNQLSQLPEEIAQIQQFRKIYLGGNPKLVSPPPEVVAQGTDAILTYLWELLEDKGPGPRYEAKLLLVGEGGTGKSSLLRVLRGETFAPHLPSTHGIEVDRLPLPHPRQADTELTLNTWDFGGQEIYQATHQFFLTKRSLYLLLWNARLGAEQERLN